MTGRRSDAVYCSRRCKTAASDARRRLDGRARTRDRSRYPREADQRREAARVLGHAIRANVISHYGHTCAECGSADQLELDHVHGNGELHRDEVGHGDAFFRHINRVRFPLECERGGEYELQVLCRSCHTQKTVRERRERKERG